MQSDLKLAADELQKMWTEIMYSYLPTPEEMEKYRATTIAFLFSQKVKYYFGTEEVSYLGKLNRREILIFDELTTEEFIYEFFDKILNIHKNRSVIIASQFNKICLEAKLSKVLVISGWYLTPKITWVSIKQGSTF